MRSHRNICFEFSTFFTVKFGNFMTVKMFIYPFGLVLQLHLSLCINVAYKHEIRNNSHLVLFIFTIVWNKHFTVWHNTTQLASVWLTWRSHQNKPHLLLPNGYTYNTPLQRIRESAIFTQRLLNMSNTTRMR